MSTIAELAQWPETEDAVTVASMHRALLVWAKVYECRLVDAVKRHDDDSAVSYAAVSGAMTTAGILLRRLNNADPEMALKIAHLYWRGGDDGEVFAEALLDDLDEIDPELAEAIVETFDAANAVTA